jgi:hypothetical protein
LRSEADRAAVPEEAEEIRQQYGVTGVPFFVFDNKYVVLRMWFALIIQTGLWCLVVRNQLSFCQFSTKLQHRSKNHCKCELFC